MKRKQILTCSMISKLGNSRMAPPIVVGILFLLGAVHSNPTPNKLLADDVNYRLSTGVVPTKYTIKLTFPESAFTKDGNEFTGSVSVDFRVDADITAITFHVADEYITITKLTVTNLDLDPTRGDYTINPTTDILTIPTDGMPITKGKSYKMVIEYKGKISTDDNYGIYKSSYTNSQKETIYLLATQFEPVYTRRAFPCFDEPSFKATYDVSITYPTKNNLGVLFNTAQKTSSDGTGTKTVTFDTTPTMSSYLLALVVSDFTSTKGANVEGDKVPYAVWSRNDLATSRDYAKEVGPTILQKLNAYTGYSYGTDLTKLDQIALPDFASGAMENWGLVTYRERLLLWNQDDSSTTYKQSILTIIAHELAHQWFGNLITCNWWSETFLNEGFATYFEYFTAHEVEPTWELDKQFILAALQLALESDALDTSQALQSVASTPQEIKDKFGVVSYKKGGSVLRMVSHIMGQAQFKAGIQEYVKTATLQHSTSLPSQLWNILGKHVDAEISVLPEGVTLTTAMQNWVEKSGYPLLSVSLDGKNLKISQERFLLTGEDKVTKWYVPITYVESESPTKFQTTNPIEWLTPENPEITLTLENNNSWVLLNPLQTGYYRVKYDTNLWTQISTALKKENFDGIIDLNRAQIVDDLFNLAKANKMDFSAVLELVDFLKNDTSYYPWVPAFKGFDYMRQRIPDGTELRTKLDETLLTLLDALYKSVSFTEVKDNDQIYTFKQVLAISWACTLGEENCVSQAKTLFNEYKIKATKPNKNLRTIVYCNALRNSEDASDYEFLWGKYAETEIAGEKNSIVSSLGCSNSEEKLKELLSETIKTAGESKIRTQDSQSVFAVVYGGSQKGVDVTLDFLQNNLPAVLNKFTTVSAQKSIITGLSDKLTTTAQVQKFKTLVESNAAFPSEIKDDSEKALKGAESNLKWIADHQHDLNKFYGIDDTPVNPGGGANTAHINMVLLTVVTVFSLLGFLSK